MKRNLVLGGLCLFFGLVALAVPAMASVQFNVAGGNLVVRGEGHTETVNSVTLSVPTGGNGTLAIGTTINFDYSGTVTNLPVAGSLTCAGTIAGCANFTAVPTGNRVTVTVGPAAVTVAAGDSITLQGIRVDVAGLGVGITTVTATLSSSPPSSNVTYNPTSVPVGVVVAPSIKVKYTPTSSGVLTCNPATQAGSVNVGGTLAANQFTVAVKENTQRAFTSLVNENAFTPAVPVVNGTTVVVKITGVPASLNVHFDGFSLPLIGLFTGPTESSDQTSTGPTAVETFTFTVAAPTPGIDSEVFTFSVYLKGSNTLALGPQTITASTELGPTGTVATTPSATPAVLFADLPVVGTVAGVSDCVTNLLFPWVVVDAPGGTYDTGIAIANTSKDAFPIGSATPQTGSCSFTGWNFTSGAAVALTPAIGPVAAGQTAALVLSTHTEFAAFRGYAIAVCGFQNGHAFAFITQNNNTSAGTSQGYIALVIPNPSLVPRSPAGGGSGEALGH